MYHSLRIVALCVPVRALPSRLWLLFDQCSLELFNVRIRLNRFCDAQGVAQAVLWRYFEFVI